MSRKAQSTTLRLAALTAPRDFEVMPDAEARSAMAERLGALALRKVSLAGHVAPEGDGDVRLDARLGATVVQACAVTLEPVTTRIDEDLRRLYLAEMPTLPPGEEIEMPEDADVEALPETLDLALVLEEALSLAMPMFPRSKGADPAEMTVTEPGKRAMTDEDVRPFASLAEFRERLRRKDD